MTNPRLIKFLQLLKAKQKSDTWNLIVISGTMGLGKSCLAHKMAIGLSKLNNAKFDLSTNMTYLREELRTMIDGSDDKKTGQLPEYSVILVDELVSLFFNRNFHNTEQIAMLELLNKCRDRHLTLIGCVPEFHSLDKALLYLVDFWVHIESRSNAYVFKRDSNPFAKDSWNINANHKLWVTKRIRNSVNYVCDVNWNDWSSDEKEGYYHIRNKKRINTEDQGKRKDRKHKLRKQRDAMLLYMYDKYIENNWEFKASEVSKEIGMHHTTINGILDNEQRL